MKTRQCPRLLRFALSWFVVLLFFIGISAERVRADRHQHRVGGERPEVGVGDQEDIRHQAATRRQLHTKREKHVSIASCSKVAYGELSQAVVRNKGKETLGGEGRGENPLAVVLPPNPDGPTLVDLGLYIRQITDINEAENHFVVNALMDLVWCDPRLSYDPSHGPDRKIYLEEDAAAKLTEIWWPDVTFPNEVDPRDAENQVLVINPDGTVEYDERFTVRLEAHFDLHQFPFDHQRLELEIESFAWPQHALRLHRQSHRIGFGNQYELPEWHITGLKTEVRSVREIQDRDEFSEFLMTIDVARQFGFYLWKLLLPLVLLVMVSWIVFWMTEIEIHDRMNISFLGLLTVVAYQFFATDDLPAIPYFTFMDGILSISFAVMILSVFESLAVHLLTARHKKATAERLDRTSRWLFPLTYIGALIVLSTFYF